jgi:uncharacterized OB-fold protein
MGDSMQKQCPRCGLIQPLDAVQCPQCGRRFRTTLPRISYTGPVVLFTVILGVGTIFLGLLWAFLRVTDFLTRLLFGP